LADKKKNDFRSNLRRMVFRALKATIKGVLVYAIYFVAWGFIAPVAQIVPGLQASLEAFVAVYVVLMVIGEFTSGTVYQYFFGAAKALFIVAYLIMSLNGGIMSMAFEGINLLVDLRLFLVITMILSLLGLAKSVIQAINFMSEKAELTGPAIVSSS
jgi:hypothetical protein